MKELIESILFAIVAIVLFVLFLAATPDQFSAECERLREEMSEKGSAGNPAKANRPSASARVGGETVCDVPTARPLTCRKSSLRGSAEPSNPRSLQKTAEPD